MADNQLTNVNDTIEFVPSRERNGTIAGQLDFGTGVGAVVILEGKIADARGWKQIKLTDPTTKTDMDNLSADEQIGWCENIGYSRCRWRLTALASGGPVQVATGVREN